MMMGLINGMENTILFTLLIATSAVFCNPLPTLSSSSNSTAKEEVLGPGKHDWGYVEVRPGAHMFWLLYFTINSQVSSPYEKPLVIWLQGGPGASGTGYGNFAEIGPVDIDLKPRNNSWVNECNILFIDNPVGTGFSHVDSDEILATNNTQIAEDLLNLMKSFFNLKPEFRKVPTYIFSESYGGKMAVDFALIWYQNRSSIESNLRGVALGDASISPKDIMESWGPYLLRRGLIDENTSKEIEMKTEAVKEAMARKNWHEAKKLYNRVLNFATEEAKVMNVYNVLDANGEARVTQDLKALNDLMNGKVKEALNITNVTYVVRSGPVYRALRDCIRPVSDVVERLLNETDLKIFAYSGELDLIINSIGTYRWSKKLSWKHAEEWRSINKTPIFINGVIEAYQKTFDRFSFFWILRSGHMVPKDNPSAMLEVLKNMINT